MASNHGQVCQRWVDRATGATTRRQLTGSRIFGDDTTIYSYGRHFPLAHALRDKGSNVVLFLLNGDRYSVSTSKHQSEIRSAVSRTDIPNVIIPFSALDAAGIVRDTIELISGEADQTVTTHHETREFQSGWQWRTDEISDYVDKTDAEIEALLARRNEHRILSTPLTRDDLPWHETRTWQKIGEERRLYLSHQSNQRIEVTEDEQGPVYRWTTTRHWLGESLIRAQVRSFKRVNCRACKGSGRAAEPWEHPAEDYRHGWGLQYHCDKCGGRGGRTVEKTRTAFFLSGFDRNETRRSYFFCELPAGVDVTNVEEALEALKPETVKVAEQHGRTVHRQGDIFAIEVPTLDKRALRQQGATFTRGGTLHGTNHVGTEVAVLPNGTTLARGSLRHEPGFRRADHRRVTLGKSWHVIVKNTVPVTKH